MFITKWQFFIQLDSIGRFVSSPYQFIDFIYRYPRNSIRFSIFEIEYVTDPADTREMQPNLVTHEILSIMIHRNDDTVTQSDRYDIKIIIDAIGARLRDVHVPLINLFVILRAFVPNISAKFH